MHTRQQQMNNYKRLTHTGMHAKVGIASQATNRGTHTHSRLGKTAEARVGACVRTDANRMHHTRRETGRPQNSCRKTYGGVHRSFPGRSSPAKLKKIMTMHSPLRPFIMNTEHAQHIGCNAPIGPPSSLSQYYSIQNFPQNAIIPKDCPIILH